MGGGQIRLSEIRISFAEPLRIEKIYFLPLECDPPNPGEDYRGPCVNNREELKKTPNQIQINRPSEKVVK